MEFNNDFPSKKKSTMIKCKSLHYVYGVPNNKTISNQIFFSKKTTENNTSNYISLKNLNKYNLNIIKRKTKTKCWPGHLKSPCQNEEVLWAKLETPYASVQLGQAIGVAVFEAIKAIGDNRWSNRNDIWVVLFLFFFKYLDYLFLWGCQLVY